MSRITVQRIVNAPVDRVFATVAHIENFSQAIPHLVDVEFLTDRRSGVGARFRETRLMGKRRASTVLEVTEYVERERIRLVSDAGGTIWDSVFTTTPNADGATELRLAMEARPYRLTARLLNPLIAGVVRRAIEADMDAVKAYCESSSSSS